MYKSNVEKLRERLKLSLEKINKDKKPYVVRGMPGTTLYLTERQAGLRSDLLPKL